MSIAVIATIFSQRTGHCVLMLLLFAPRTFAQTKNTNIYPYGGDQDSNYQLHFSIANFDSSRFGEYASFNNAIFNCRAKFFNANFDTAAEFYQASFNNQVDFRNARFNGDVNFNYAEFADTADFCIKRITVLRRDAPSFLLSGRPTGAFFVNKAHFSGAKFKSLANFGRTVFSDDVTFHYATFDDLADFNHSEFMKTVDFRDTKFDRVIFDGALIHEKLLLGSSSEQKFDFTWTFFLPDAKLELHGLVDLNIQPEKIRYISFGDDLSYFRKKHILENLKGRSFKDENGVHFELDYIFAKSTMYQVKTDYTYKIKVWHWPEWIVNTFYYLTMGFGYRPFRLVYWILGLIVLFSFIYWRTFPLYVNRYIKQDARISHMKILHANDFGTILNCVYFSTMVLFTFRLKRDILTFFSAKQKKIIVTEWMLGFLIYVAFLTLSKSGSILQQLKDLFVG